MKPVKGTMMIFISNPEVAKRNTPPTIPVINATPNTPNQTTREQKKRSTEVARALWRAR